MSLILRLFYGNVWLQGDREAELGLPISPLCDRHNTLVAQSQIGMWRVSRRFIATTNLEYWDVVMSTVAGYGLNW